MLKRLKNNRGDFLDKLLILLVVAVCALGFLAVIGVIKKSFSASSNQSQDIFNSSALKSDIHEQIERTNQQTRDLQQAQDQKIQDYKNRSTSSSSSDSRYQQRELMRNMRDKMRDLNRN